MNRSIENTPIRDMDTENNTENRFLLAQSKHVETKGGMKWRQEGLQEVQEGRLADGG